MAISIEFPYSYSYAAYDTIEIPITLVLGRKKVDLLASLDTGASNCIFERRIATMLEIDIGAGRPQRFSTATGSFQTYEHHVGIQTLGIEFSAPVFFAESPAFDRNVVGRHGWLDRLRLAIIDHDQQLYLSPYDSQ